MVKQRSKHKIYNNYDKESDNEETELFVRKSSPRKEIPSIEKDIEDGDTLQSIAIKYHCTIEDLKRLNNIHKENEIYARNKIKVPIHPISMAIAGVHDPCISNLRTELIDLSDITPTIKSQDDTIVNEIIFNSSIVQQTSETKDDIIDNIYDEEVCLLPNEVITEPILTKLNCNGADGDIPLMGLLVFIVILIFAVPLIYVFYVAEHHHDHS